MKCFFIKLFSSLFLLFITHTTFATEVCPISGKITILCHKNPSVNAISLTGCFNGGLAYLCTSQITSCEAVNENSIQTVQWTMPEYDSKNFKFICPGEGRETMAKQISIDATIWKNTAENAILKNNPNICPKDKLPVLCNQQSNGISLIGCHSAGLSYLCSNQLKSCDQVNDQTLSSSTWTQAQYNDRKLVFECPGMHITNIHKHIIVRTESWEEAVKKAY